MAKFPPGSTQSAGGRTYARVGRCIYCGATAGLTREHIVPFAISGDLILPDASCKDCSRVTSSLETSLLKDSFGLIRNKYGYRTQNSKKRHNKSEFEFCIIDSNGNKTAVNNSGDFIPLVSWALPFIREPGLMLRESLENVTKDDETMVVISEHDINAMKRIAGNDHGFEFLSGTVNLDKFYRAVAKIAHSFAVATLGIERCNWLLTEIIINGCPDIRNFVGGIKNIEPIENLSYFITLGTCNINEKRLLLAKLRFFCYLATPTYIAVLADNIPEDVFFPDWATYRKPIRFTFVDSKGNEIYKAPMDYRIV